MLYPLSTVQPSKSQIEFPTLLSTPWLLLHPHLLLFTTQSINLLKLPEKKKKNTVRILKKVRVDSTKRKEEENQHV